MASPRTSARPILHKYSYWRACAIFLIPFGTVVMLLWAISGSATAATPDTALYVVPGGLTSGTCLRTTTISPTNPYNYDDACDLEYALEIAVDGDGLWLSEGTYPHNIVISKNVSLEGGFINGFKDPSAPATDPVADPNAYESILAGGAGAPVVSILGVSTTTATSVRLDGLQISHQTSDGQSTGISLTRVVSPVMTGVQVELHLLRSKIFDNQTAGNGGGLTIDPALTVTIGITDTLFLNNVAGGLGGALYLPGFAIRSASFVSLTLQANQAGTHGGGMYATGLDLVLDRSTIVSNVVTTGHGGGVYVDQGSLGASSSYWQGNQAAGIGGALLVTGTQSVTLQDNLLRGNSAGSGGALGAVNASLTAPNGFGLANNAATALGGGAYLENSSLSITGLLSASHNSAQTGGGLYLMAASALTATTSQLANNAATTDGGGLALNASSVAIADASTFFSNTTQTGDGAGLHARAGSTTRWGATRLEHNHAGNDGGGWYLTDTTATIDALTALSNTTGSGKGGAIFGENGSLSVSGALVLTHNRAETDGGGVYVDGVTASISGATEAYSNTAAAGDGGAIYVTGGGSISFASTLTLRQNRAQESGGGIAIAEGAITTVGATNVVSNTATSGHGGGFFFQNDVTGAFNAVTMTENRAELHGGGLYAANSNLQFASIAVVDHNTSTVGSGGGLYLTAGITTSFSLLELANNQAQHHGGGLYADGIRLTFGDNSTITANKAITGSGGGIYADGGSLLFATVSIDGNSAQKNGGGLFALSSDLSLADDSVVANNQAGSGEQPGSGGGIYLSGGAAHLSTMDIRDNQAYLDGGGLFLLGGALTMDQTVEVLRNQATTGNGGGIYVQGGNALVNASLITNNRARANGGGLYVLTGDVGISGATQIASNTAISVSGGGLAVVSGTVAITGSVVRNNNAQTDGGGIYARGSNLVSLRESVELKDNTAVQGRGGGAYVQATRAEIDTSTVSGNTAASGGGGLYAETTTVIVQSSLLTSNDGGTGPGGAAFVESQLATLQFNQINANETAGNGGGLAFADTTDTTIFSNTITANKVRLDVVPLVSVLTEDAVINAGDTVVTVAKAGDTVTAEESSEGFGAGIYAIGTSGVIDYNFLLDNENQSGDGGGLYLNSSAISMTNNVVARNSIPYSSTYGAGVYLTSSTARIVHTTIVNNENKSTTDGSLSVGIYATKASSGTTAVDLVNSLITGQDIGFLLLAGNTANMHGNSWSNDQTDWDGSGQFGSVSRQSRGDPRYVNEAAGNYRIRRDSAAFDAGIDAGVAIDIEGTRRPIAYATDSGAYEQRYVRGIYLDVEASPAFVNNGDTVEYHVRVLNDSGSAINNVTVNIGLPGQQAATSISGGSCSGTSCNFASLATGQLEEITLLATATGVPPDQGFIAMVTNVTVSSPDFLESDTSESLLSRLQKCRIHYAGTDFGTVQQAIDAVDDFDDVEDIIRVNGYCGGSVNINKKVTLQGGWNASLTVRDPEQFPTVIDAAGTGRVLNITGDIAPTISGFQLLNGSAAGQGGGPAGKDAGGIVYIQDANATLENVVMGAGNSPDYGGALFVDRLTTSTIRDSIIEGSSAGDSGGGVYANESSPEIVNTIIRNNVAKAGGGAYLRKGSAKLIDCTIQNNRATGTAKFLEVAGFNFRLSVGGGGGVHLDESKGSVSGCLIEGNTAKAGGAVFADNSPGSISNSTIRNNQATGSPSVVPVIILANTAGGGGAVYAQRSDLAIEYNTIVGNRSSSDGGAIYVFNASSDGKVNGNYIGFNEANNGSAIYVHLRPDTFKIFVLPITLPDFLIPLILGQPQPEPPKLTMYQNTIAHNSGSSAVYLFGESFGDMVGNLFAFNSGAAVKAETQVLPYVALIPVPIIFVIPVPFPVFYIPTVNAEHNLFYENGSDTSTSGVGASVSSADAVQGNPHLKDDGIHIKRISAAYNAGKNAGIAVDLDADSRPLGDFTEIGADEYPSIGVRYVAPNGGDDGGNFCRDYTNPCHTLQTAIDAALEGDIIKVAGGTYTGVENRRGLPQMGYITKTIQIQGGYYPTVSPPTTDSLYTQDDWEDPHPDVNPSILDAAGQGRVFYIADEKRKDQDGNDIEVNPTISGFQIRNGNATGLNGPQANAFDAGGAIYVDIAQAVITDVVISNSVADFGGAIYMISSTLDLDDVSITNNLAHVRGGGFYLETSDDVMIEDIVIENNRAPLGGGFYLDRSAALIKRNQIRNNGDASTNGGGALYLDASAANIISNTIVANTAARGGGLFLTGSEAQVFGNTIQNNVAAANASGPGRGGGFFIEPGAAQIFENLISANRADAGGGLFLDLSDALVSRNQVINNEANVSGGGLYLRETSDASLDNNLVDGNTANGTGDNDGGGGLYFESSNASFIESTISNNSAQAGGGAYLFSFSNANLQDNQITGNSAQEDGGGVYLKLSSANVENNNILRNTTISGDGGGIYAKLSGAQIISNTINENTAAFFGGGLFLDESGVRVERGTIDSNVALDGGGIYLLRSNTATMKSLSILSNQANGNGGGIFIRLSDITFEGHTFTGNLAAKSGGGLYLDESDVNLERVIVRDSEASESGGGLTIANDSQAALVSSVFIDNESGGTGSGIYVAGSSPSLVHTTIARNRGGDGTGITADKFNGKISSVTMVNTILANQDLAVRATNGNTISLQATLWDTNQVDFQLSAGAILTGSEDLNFFGSANFLADGYHIDNNSKASSVGVFTQVARDIDAEGRPQGSGPELGADELSANCAAVASSNLDVTFATVQAAIDAADPGDEIRISGTCVGVEVRDGRPQAGLVNKDLVIRGGYTPTNWIASYPITQPTVIDALGEGRVFFVTPGAKATIEDMTISGGTAQGLGGGPGALDAGGAIYIRDATVTMRNLTIFGGDAFYGGALFLQGGGGELTDSSIANSSGIKGGAVFLRNSTATLRNNVIRGASADDGGGIFLSFSQPVLTANQVIQNIATSAGGGIFLESSAATLRSNTISTNTAQAGGGLYLDASNAIVQRNQINANEGQNGGGLYLSDSDAAVDGNRFVSNSASIGGGVYLEAGEPELINNVVARNVGQIRASALYLLSTNPTLIHNTIADNTGGDGSGLYVTDLGVEPTSVELVNNIIVNHTSAISVTAGNQVALRSNLLFGNQTEAAGSGLVEETGNNIRQSPSFVDPAAHDYHLTGNSAARDTGVDAGVTVDFDGQIRPADNGFDIGADEVVRLGLQLTVQTIPNPALFGRPVEFIVRAVNVGNVDVTAFITATLPIEVEPNGVFSYTAHIAQGEAWTQKIDAVVQDGFEGLIVITVDAVTDQGASDTIEVEIESQRPDAGMVLTAEVIPSPAPPGSTVNYRIKLTNSGNEMITPTIEAILPRQVSTASELQWTPAALNTGGNWTKSLNATVADDASGDLVAVFRASSPNGVSDVFTLTTPVARPQLELSAIASPRPATSGRPVTYTIVVTNAGNVDFTLNITDIIPVDENGRPLVSPGIDQIFRDVNLPAGSVFRQDIVLVIEPGFAGTLTNRLVAVSDSGFTSQIVDTLEASPATLGPTIVAIGNGAWEDPNNWLPNRVPLPTDIALVPEEFTLTVDGAQTNPITLLGLINHGVINLNCVSGVPLTLDIADTLINTGLIAGRDGQAVGESGCAVEVQTGTLENDGIIRSGNGFDGGFDDNGNLIDAGDGGAMTVFAQIVVNDGQIIAGDGGNAPDGGNAGNGGNAIIIAGPPNPALLLNRGAILAGNGGNGREGDPGGAGGNGGELGLLSTSLLLLDGGSQRGGDGGLGNPPGNAGAESRGAADIWQDGLLSSNGTDFAFTTLSPGTVRGARAGTVFLPLFFLNTGLQDDTYQLFWSNSAGWDFSNLPVRVSAESLRFNLALLRLRLPATARIGDFTILELTARSLGAPDIFITRQIRVVVSRGAGVVFLPLVGDGPDRSPPPPVNSEELPVTTFIPQIWRQK